MAYGDGKAAVVQASQFEQLIIWLREDIIGEFEAINQYQQHIDNIDNEEVKELMIHIRNDEKEHVAELTHLLTRIDEIQRQKFLEDHTVAPADKVVTGDAAPTDKTPTVGSLK